VREHIVQLLMDELRWGGPFLVLPQNSGDPSSEHPAAGLDLESLELRVRTCRACRLAATRKNTVFGEGDPRARLMFIGEGPGAVEDDTGRPFVGPAGELLTRIIAAMGLDRKDVYIANVVKCRPPGNRDPEPDEIRACMGYLEDQIRLVGPQVIVALGRVASHALLDETTPIGRLRGTFRRYGDIPLMPTYHPSYLLQNEARKKDVWEDMKKVMYVLGLKRVQRGSPGRS